MRHDERIIYFYDLKVSSRAVHAEMPTLRHLLDILAAEVDAGRFRTAGDRKNNIFHFLAPPVFDEANQVATLLIRKSDKRTPDHGYSDLASGALTMFAKQENQGGDAAAHVVVSWRPSGPHTYVCLIERVYGVNHRNVTSLLNNLLRAYYRANPGAFAYPDPAGARTRDGTIRMHPFMPILSVAGHISEQLHQDIENGTITEVELRNDSVRTTVGNSPYIKTTGFRLSLKVEPKIPRSNLLQTLVDAMRTKQRTYETARIYFKDPTGHPKSVELDLATGDIEQAYVKAIRIGKIFPPLQMTTDRIVPRVADPMKQLCIDNR